MRIRDCLVHVAVVLAASWTLAAHATLVTGGFSGQIFSGFDLSSGQGFFGLGDDLEDQPISGTFSYDTAEVPPPSSQTSNSATYSDPTFSTDFLHFSVTINGRTYTFGGFAAPPGIQSIDVIDNTDQLQYDYERFGLTDSESITLRFISDLDFLSGTGVPTHFDFVASGIGLTPGGSFSFDRANGDFASASFTIEQGFARAAGLPEPGTLGIVAAGWLALAGVRRRARVTS